jgi:hypothetical protein
MHSRNDNAQCRRTKMFRFNEPTKEWKERGTGDVRFLRHKVTNKVRVLMRAEKTLRVRANHPLTTSLELKPHAGSDRAFTYFTPDWSEDPETGIIEQRNELFAFRFANPESENSPYLFVDCNNFLICFSCQMLPSSKRLSKNVARVILLDLR